MKRRAAPDDVQLGGPTWIVSYCSMFTLMLAFFVVIQTMAKSKEGILLRAGQDSFRRAVAGMGVPNLLFRSSQREKFDFRKIKYPTEEDDEESTSRVIDAQDEQIRSTFDRLKRAAGVEARSSGGPANVMVTPIRFGSSQDGLDEEAVRYLRELAGELARNWGDPNSPVKVYVVATAADEDRPDRHWLLSARRARRVELVLKQELSTRSQTRYWEVESFGAGQGGRWRQELGLDSAKSFVAIAVVGADKRL